MHNDLRMSGAVWRRSALAALLATASALGVGAFAQGAAAEDKEAKAFVDSLYAKRIETVQRTRDSDDDVALMREMLDIAPTLPKQPDARSVLYARVGEMAKQARAGFGVAFEALEALEKHNPRHPACGDEAKLDLYQAWYRGVDRDEREPVAAQYFEKLVAAADAALERGDHAQAKRWYSEAGSVHRVARLDGEFDLRAKLVETRAVERLQQEIDQLQSAVRDGLSPEQARRLVVLLALEMNQYERAASYAPLVKDDGFMKGLQSATALGGRAMAQQEDGEHPPSYWYMAGHWYAQMADEPNLTEKASERALSLARLALHRYVDSTAQDNIEKARAAILVRQLDERYAEKYGEKQADPRDIMRLLDPGKHMISGKPFTVEAGKIVLPAMSILSVPVEGGDQYAFTIKAEADGAKEIAMWVWLPIGDRNTLLWIDGGDTRYSRVEGLAGIKDSEKTMTMNLGKPVEYRIEVKQVKGDKTQMRIQVDGKEVWAWRDATSRLGDATFGDLPNKKHFAVRGGAGLVIEKIQLQRYDSKDD
ncbi:MAG: hypothetical protein ACE37H_10900 [Phycisphaeraceae bacterium]